MITKLQIQNFKSHKNTTLSFGNLTLLCGENGVGKSSIIQSLLLLRQNYQQNNLQEYLDLSGDLCQIGFVKDACYQYTKEDFLGIKLETNNEKLEWNFLYDLLDVRATILKIKSFKGEIDSLKSNSLINEKFQYLSTERLAPQKSYKKDDKLVIVKKQISQIKGQAELIAHFLNHYGKENIEFDTLIKDTFSPDLLSQTIAWEKEISQHINVKIEENGTGFAIKYNFDVKDGVPTNDFRAENVGFGVTYALPIIVSILAAKKDALILIENPEAHLHPKAQAKLAELMCIAAQAGIQIIAETHSDHIINGILVGCKNKKIEKDNVKIYQFNRNEKLHCCETVNIEILDGGKIKNQPADFFDQIDKDLEILMGF